MTTKTLIAAAAVAAGLAAAAPMQLAEAKTSVNVNIGIGMGGYGSGYSPYYHPMMNCRSASYVVSRNGFRGVYPVDCRLPGYKYVGWRWGHQYVVSVNGFGQITNVQPAYW